MWAKLGVLGAPQIRAFSLIGMLLFIQFIFALLFGGDNTWVAELAGFVTGLGMTVLLAPGGVAHLVSIIRRR